MTRKSDLNKKIQVLVVDDHPIVREGVRRRIEAQPDMAVCCEVGRGPEAMAFLQKNQVDFAIVDISLEGRSGIDLIKQIRALKLGFPILVLSVHDEVTYAQRALAAGAQGYLLKSEAPGRIIEAQRRLLAGEFYISRSIANKLFARMGGTGDRDSGVTNISDRELEVLEAVGKGLSTRRTAQALSLSISTIETYKHRLKVKLGIHSAAELATYASVWSKDKEDS
jgi:DNA-binding NarL/FixJ family response regulator